jgi:hypothetical protein
MKKVFSIMLMILISLNIVTAIGVTLPYPDSFQLYPEETGNFVFQVQAGSNEVSVEFEVDSVLDFNFPDSFILNASQRKNIYASVFVPQETSVGIYEESFCVKFCPTDPNNINVCSRVCGLGINVNVLGNDEDDDGVLDDEDKCSGTLGEVISQGCSCEQILELKPGEDTLENRKGCSKGLISVFEKTIGWAMDLFD